MHAVTTHRGAGWLHNVMLHGRQIRHPLDHSTERQYCLVHGQCTRTPYLDSVPERTIPCAFLDLRSLPRTPCKLCHSLAPCYYVVEARGLI